MANCFCIKGEKMLLWLNVLPHPITPSLYQFTPCLMSPRDEVNLERLKECKNNKEAESELWLCLTLQQHSQIGFNSPVLRVEHNPANALSPTVSRPDSPVSGLSCSHTFRVNTCTLTFEYRMTHHNQDLLLLFSTRSEMHKQVCRDRIFQGLPVSTVRFSYTNRVMRKSLQAEGDFFASLLFLSHSLSHAGTL